MKAGCGRFGSRERARCTIARLLSSLCVIPFAILFFQGKPAHALLLLLVRMNPLETRLKYKFRNALLLAEALTHPSLGHETQRHHFDNQRLEFLGDAVLQLIFTEWLFDRFPKFSEGQLTKMRSGLVSRDGLKMHAARLALGQHLMMGRGEESSGGRERSSALADAYEALIGAIYLDSDYVTVRRIVLTEAREDLDTLEVDPPDQNPKGQLQEVLQAISPVSPIYPILSAEGPEHQKDFIAQVTWNGIELGEGTGRSKKDAETAAARDALIKRKWDETGVVAKKPRKTTANKSPRTPRN